jgi:protein involved in polysaccharide export with SLBB domain
MTFNRRMSFRFLLALLSAIAIIAYRTAHAQTFPGFPIAVGTPAPASNPPPPSNPGYTYPPAAYPSQSYQPGTSAQPPVAGAPAPYPSVPPSAAVPGASAPSTVPPGWTVPANSPNTQFMAPATGLPSAGSVPSAMGALLNGTGVSPAQAAQMLQSVSPNALGTVASQLDITPDQIQALSNQLASGTLSSDQLDLLGAKIAAKGMSDSDVASMAGALGLSGATLNTLQSRVAQFRTQNAPMQAAGAAPPPPSANFAMSSLENSFTQAASGQVQEFATPVQLTQYGYSMFNSQVSTFAPTNNIPVSDDYVVGPGDTFNVLVWGRVNDSWSLQVQRNGQVDVPQIGPLDVAGLTFEQAKKLIEDKATQMTGVHANVTMGELRTIQVFVVGEVSQPGPYTLSALSRVSNALAAAGGISKIGSLRRIQVKRSNQIVKTVDLYAVLMRGDTSSDLRLQQDDVIHVPVIGPTFGITGVVKRPAIYEMIHPSERLSDAIALGGGVGPFAYTERIQVQRVENHVRKVVLDTTVNQLSSAKFDTIDGDLIRVFPVLPVQKNKVTLIGNVYRAGDFQWYRGMRVSDLVNLGEGVEPHTYFNYALVARLEPPQLYPHYMPVDLGKVLDSPGGSADLELQPLDQVTVYSEDSLRDLPTVTVTGEVRMPGKYRMDPKMRVSDLIYLAGGLRDDAYRDKATLARTQVIDGVRTQHSYIDVNLKTALTPSSQNNPLLENNDQLFISAANDWHLPWTIAVAGRVKRPGTYAIRDGETLDEVLNQAGGFLPDAFPKGIIFTRTSVRMAEQKRLQDSMENLAQDLVQLELMATAQGGAAAGGGANLAAEISAIQQLLAQAQSAQADGRIVVPVAGAEQSRMSTMPVMLQDGDNLTVPVRPVSVNVLGQVYSPTSILARPHMTVREYLYKAGGPTLNGDMDNLMVVKADGAIITDKGLREGEKNGLFPMLPVISGGIMAKELDVGDTVFVPQNVQSFIKLQYGKDIATILGQAATTLGIVGLLATKL